MCLSGLLFFLFFLNEPPAAAPDSSRDRPLFTVEEDYDTM